MFRRGRGAGGEEQQQQRYRSMSTRQQTPLKREGKTNFAHEDRMTCGQPLGDVKEMLMA
jgi:hypothetical protein